ncbi:hypothetical protein C7271_07910 [filamentous cyanobacterium CCP5]|nr:hypothetical protein C7271_07910 [filamentous cyanobacterium CCP5]
MLKGRKIIGKPIVAYATGEKVAQVKDLIFDYHQNRVLGLLVVEESWLRKGQAVATDAIRSIGPDSVIITTKEAVMDLAEQPALMAVMEDDQALIHAQIMTTDGQHLGTILDLYFDDQTWEVKGYEASGGPFADLYSGRSFIPAPQTIEIGKDYAFVEPEVAEKMKEQVSGLEAQFQAAGSKLQAAAETAGEQLHHASEAAAETFKAGRATAESQLKATQAAIAAKTQTLMPHPTLEEAKGRRAQQEVCTDSGRFVVTPGQIVTDEVIDHARSHGLEEELMAAVGLTQAEMIRQEATEAMHKTQLQIEDLSRQSGEKLTQGSEKVKQGLQHLWQNAVNRVSQLQESTVHNLEERRIQAALGRPVNRTILDDQDNVILKAGDLITHEAIARARATNTLETLLDSVEKYPFGPTHAAPS